jgi:hypothetical protein
MEIIMHKNIENELDDNTEEALRAREAEYNYLSISPQLQPDRISRITHGYYFLPNEDGSPIEPGAAAPITYVLEKGYSHARISNLPLNVIESDLELDWCQNELEDIAYGLLHTDIRHEPTVLKHLTSFTQHVVEPLKPLPCWGLTLAYVENAWAAIQAADGPAGFVSFTRSLGRELPITWIIEPEKTRAIDPRVEYDQTGFCGMWFEDHFTVFKRVSENEVVDLDDVFDDFPNKPHHLDWHNGKHVCRYIAYLMLSTIYEENLVRAVVNEFSRRMIERLPRLWWAVKENTVRALVSEILKQPNTHKPSQLN